MIRITSTTNERYKYIKSLMTKKSRLLYREYTVEGIKSVNDAINSGQAIKSILVSETFYNHTSFNYPENAEILVISDKIFPNLCDTQTPQGILAIIKMNETCDIYLKSRGLYVYCDDVRDPGNLGTIIRTAEAAGFDAVLLSGECVDVYSPKVVRASMGSYFNIDIITDIDACKLAQYKDKGAQLLGGALSSNSCDYRNFDYSNQTIIVVGNEANGISKPILDLCTLIKIPIFGKAESLNVAVAAGILIYEAVRNRN